ncbi:MAG: GNAT family N-acetyltransferase [Steroidobacteraceae bacterium]
MIATDILSETNDVRSLAAEWSSLVADSFSATFSRAEWHLAWLDAFPPKQIAVVTARESGRLVGLLPMSLVRTDVRGLFLPLATSLARGDYQPLILAAGAAREVLPALLDAAIRHFGRHVVYWFPNIPSTDPALQFLLSHLQKRQMACATSTGVASRIRIGGRSYAEVEAGWSPRHRKEVRHKRQRLEALGALRLWQPETLEEARTAVRDFFEVHDDKWLAQGQPARFHNPANRRHFLAILERFWGRGLLFSALQCGEKKIYYSFNLVSDGWILLYRPALRVEYQRYSPGTVFLSLLLEHACSSGMQGIDFLVGTEKFKLRWSNEALKVFGLHAAAHAWSPAFQWFARGKPYVLKHVEPAMARAKARWQRAAAHRIVAQASRAA